jgi:hypothetical protein
MRIFSCVLLVLTLVLAVGATSVHAQLVTYKINFMNANPLNGPSPTAGSFVYDFTTNRFLSFKVVWAGLTFDLATAANNPYIASGGPPCLSGATGPQATFELMTNCDSIGAPGVYWDGTTPPLGGPPTDTSASFVFVGTPGYVTPPSSEIIEVYNSNVVTTTQTGIAGLGSFTATPAWYVGPPSYVGVSLGQIIRVVAGPITVPPGVPVELNLGFVDINGNSIGPSSTQTLAAGESAVLDLNAATLVQEVGQRVEVRPVVTIVNANSAPGAAAGGPPAVALPEVTEVFDTVTGFGAVLVPGNTVSSAQPAFDYQGLASGQILRLVVDAYPPNSCNATVSFADRAGNPLGQSQQVNVAPGTGTAVDLNADTVGVKVGQRIEVLPTITLAPLVAGAAPSNSLCQATVEVFDRLSGRTWTYQAGGKQLPAVQ